MKKIIISLMFFPLAIFSCSKNPITIPKSPFNDSYIRKGTTSQFNYNLESLQPSEFSELKDSTDKYLKKADEYISSYTRQQEDRDLKYAYFGKEMSAISMCTFFSQKKTSTSYSNDRQIDDLPSESQRQTANGIIIDKTENIVYKHDFNGTNQYIETTEAHNNDQSVKVTNAPRPCSDKSIFNVDLSNVIKQHFFDKYTLFGQNTIYGKTNINGITKYIIKEAFSEYQDFSTNAGRTYKSVNNYFYEGMLEKKNFGFAFNSFRFYKELLILSQAISDEKTIPVLYLDSPVLVQFSESTYQVNYDTKQPHQGIIPSPTPVNLIICLKD